MITFIISKDQKGTFTKLFKFLKQYNCEVCLFPEGMKWRNHEPENKMEGIFYSKGFIGYPAVHRQKIVNLSPEFKKIEKEADLPEQYRSNKYAGSIPPQNFLLKMNIKQ